MCRASAAVDVPFRPPQLRSCGQRGLPTSGTIGGGIDAAGVSAAGRFRWFLDLRDLVGAVRAAGRLPDRGGEDLRQRTAWTVDEVARDYDASREGAAVTRLIALTAEVRASLEEEGAGQAHAEAVEALLLMLAPLAPDVSEDLWHRLGRTGSIQRASWPSTDPQGRVRPATQGQGG